MKNPGDKIEAKNRTVGEVQSAAGSQLELLGMPEKQKPKSKDSPLIAQYQKIKSKYPDAILLFRVGDFYETFGSDAVTTSQVLGIVQTKRAAGTSGETELAGFPYHALDAYLPKLIRAGFRVAICEQLEDPKKAKGLVKRGVTEILSPGLVAKEEVLEKNQNNYLACLLDQGEEIGLAFLDLSTGDVFCQSSTPSQLLKCLGHFQPSELVLSKSDYSKWASVLEAHYYCFPLENWFFENELAEQRVLDQFGVGSTKGYGLSSGDIRLRALGASLQYLQENAFQELAHLKAPRIIRPERFLGLDPFTVRNLELLESQEKGGHSLVSVIDRCQNPMGSRLLRRWIMFPILDIPEIQKRQDGVADLMQLLGPSKKALSSLLSSLGDMERLLGKLALSKISPRELHFWARSIQSLHEHWQENISESYWQEGFKVLEGLLEPAEIIKSALVEDAPAMLGKGKCFRDGHNQELDALRSISRDGKKELLKIQEREILATGISSLKIGFNNVFGYYLEVRNTHKEKVPEAWIRKQTLTQAERYVTEELKSFEEKILGADQKISSLEFEIFEELKQQIIPFLGAGQVLCHSVARLDCLLSFATQALDWNYCRPSLHNSLEILIQDGRHPVIEALMPPGDAYIPNSIKMDAESQQILLITGPNMSGKSALLRQTALICLMAQIGSFVPAKSAQLGLLDQIFTRVGASDNISSGESTFMVEMNEAAFILNNLSDRSLVLLDELGRGTSTYDGLSIAWSLIEYLHANSKSKTLFATHYHELAQLEGPLPRLKNFHVQTKESQDKILFLRKLKEGSSGHSFGIEVAKMAGMPLSLVARAKAIMKKLESQKPQEPKIEVKGDEDEATAIGMHAKSLQILQKEIEELNLNALSPMEALLKLHEWQQRLKN